MDCTIIVKDKKSNEPLEGVDIYIIEVNGTGKYGGRTNTKGKLHFQLNPGEYLLNLHKSYNEGYEDINRKLIKIESEEVVFYIGKHHEE